MEKNKKIKIGLLGFGTVGQGLKELLELNAEKMSSELGLEFEVSKILVRDHAKALKNGALESQLVKNFEEILSDSEINLIIEVMGGIEAATSYMKQAFAAGKSVVSANKAAIAANYKALHTVALDNQVHFLYEAAVAAGIPILTTLDHALKSNQISKLSGIINGTTNFILTQMYENDMAYEAAVEIARDRGYLEADPTKDVEGIDAANKLTILIAHAFGKIISMESISRQGIIELTKEDIAEAKANQQVIKLLAEAEILEDGSLKASVKPVNLPLDHPFAQVNNEFNIVKVTGNALGELSFTGKGAGGLVTASAVLGDMIEIARTSNLT